MSVVRTIPRKSRLTAMIDQPGGLSVGVALVRAQTNIDALKARSQAIVAERVAELAALATPTTPAETITRREQAYAAASAVIDAAGPYELIDLCAAARGLCDLVDAAPRDRPFDWRIVTVHAQALQLILALPPEAIQERVQVLDSLKQVLDRKLPPDTAEGTPTTPG